jgi:hypothetical protein
MLLMPMRDWDRGPVQFTLVIVLFLQGVKGSLLSRIQAPRISVLYSADEELSSLSLVVSSTIWLADGSGPRRRSVLGAGPGHAGPDANPRLRFSRQFARVSWTLLPTQYLLGEDVDECYAIMRWSPSACRSCGLQESDEPGSVQSHS